MRPLPLKEIFLLEKLIAGRLLPLTVYDPEQRLQADPAMHQHIMLHDAEQLKSLPYVPCLLVLLADVSALPALHPDSYILSFSKLKKKLAEPYTLSSWQYSLGMQGSRLTHIFREKAIDIHHIYQWLQSFYPSDNQKNLYIYGRQTLYINQQLEGFTCDGYSILLQHAEDTVNLELYNQEKAFAYARFALNDAGKQQIKQEQKVLQQCKSLLLAYMVCPETMWHSEQILVLTDPRPNDMLPQPFSRLHLEALRELYYPTLSSGLFRASALYQKIYYQVYHINTSPANVLKQEQLSRMRMQLVALLQSFEEDLLIDTAFTHGNFMPQHTHSTGERLFVHHWDKAREAYPLLYDCFHYIFHSYTSYTSIKQHIHDLKYAPWMAAFLEENNLDMDVYFRLYLLISSSHAISFYSRQSHVPAQALEMMERWQEALEDIKASSSSMNSSECVG